MTSINDLFSGRVLEFTRAEAILAALVVDIDNMKTSLSTKLNDRGETLAAQLGQFRASAVDQWLKGTGTGMATDNYDHARAAAVGRARSLERRAYAAAEAAAALATLLEGVEPLITPEDLIWRIDQAATGFYDGKYHTDAAAEADLTAIWLALAPSALVSPDAVEVLRRHYDAKITGPYLGANLPTLYAAVTEWRDHHLGAATPEQPWDAGTWAYAVGTARSWNEVADLWRMLGDDAHRTRLSAAENLRLRTTIRDRVNTTPSDYAQAPSELAEAVTEFDNGHMWLMTRVRGAETMHDLGIVATAIGGRDRAIEGGLTLMRALARRFDALKTTAPDADPEGDEWAPAAVLATAVSHWRSEVYAEAVACTTGHTAGAYDEAGRYELLACALADARHTGNADHVAKLLTAIGRVENAGADHILTPDHIGRLKAAAAQGDTAALDINGGTNQ
jgi:hypothetical protein